MAVRDERDAIRKRLEALERELAEAKQRSERTAELEGALAAKEKELAELRRDLEASQRVDAGGGAKRRTATKVAVGAILIVGAAVAAGFALRRPPDKVVDSEVDVIQLVDQVKSLPPPPPVPSVVEPKPQGPHAEDTKLRARLCSIKLASFRNYACYGFPVRSNVVLTAIGFCTGVESQPAPADDASEAHATEVEIDCPVHRAAGQASMTSSKRVHAVPVGVRDGEPEGYAVVVLEPGETFDPAQVLPLKAISDRELTHGRLETLWRVGDFLGSGTLAVRSVDPRQVTFTLVTDDPANKIGMGSPILVGAEGKLAAVGVALMHGFQGDGYHGLRVTPEMLADIDRWSREP